MIPMCEAALSFRLLKKKNKQTTKEKLKTENAGSLDSKAFINIYSETKHHISTV